MSVGEIEFSDEELSELGIELVEGEARGKKRGVMRVPLDEVPRAPSGPVTVPEAKSGNATIRVKAFSQTDLLVDAAFEKMNGSAGAVRPQQAVSDSPWDTDSEVEAADEDEDDLVIDEDFPAAKTTISAPPSVPAVPQEVSDRPAERITLETEAPRLPAGLDDDMPISSSPPYVPSAAPAAAVSLAPPLMTPAAGPPPLPVDEADAEVVSSSPAPDRSGPRVAVSDGVSGRVADGTKASLKVAEESEELHGDEIEEVKTPPPTKVPVSVTPPAVPAAEKPAVAAAGPAAAKPSASGPGAAPPLPKPSSTNPGALPPPKPSATNPGSLPKPSATNPGSLPKPSSTNPGAKPAPPMTPPPMPALSAVPPAMNTPPPIVPAPAAAAAPQASAPPTVPASALEDKPRRKRRTKQWFEEIFDEDYLRTLPFMTPRQTEREAAFIVESLQVGDGASLLDLGCGYGRHAMELAARGHKVTGLDLSLPLLIRAADAARRVGVNVNFVHGDMRELAFENEFDAAYCFFTTFGYFDDDGNRKVLASIAKSLKPGGRFLLDVVNRDYLIGDLPTRVWWQGEGCVVLEEVDFNYFTSRLQVQRSIVFEDGRQSEQEISIRSYSLHEIGKVLHHAGFRVIEVSGSLALRGRFFGTESRQILVVAEKRKEP